MKAVKISRANTTIIDQKTKKIIKYNFPTKIMSLSYMVIDGRHPEGKRELFEKDCSFVMYVTEGSGKYIVDGEKIEVKVGDAVFVRAGSTFVAEGSFEYVIVVVPAFHEDSIEEIDQ